MMKIEEISELLKRYEKMLKAIAAFQQFAVSYVNDEDLQKIGRHLTAMNLLLNELDYKVRYEDEN